MTIIVNILKGVILTLTFQGNLNLSDWTEDLLNRDESISNSINLVNYL